MPFDISSAKPIAPKFDLSSAKPVDEATGLSVPQAAGAEFKKGNLYDLFNEPALALGSGAIAQPLSGLAGIGAYAAKGAGYLASKVGIKNKLQDIDPANVVETVQNKLTYQPKTDIGKIGADAVSYPFRKLDQFADYAGGKTSDLTSSPLIGAGVKTAIDFAPSVLLKNVGGKKIAEAPAEPQLTARQSSAIDAKKAGYKLTPMQQGKPVASAVESVVGRPQLERDISAKNADVTDNLGKKALGLKPDQPLNKATIDGVKQEANKAYDAVAQTGKVTASPEYQAAVSKIADRTGSESFPGDVPPTIQKLKDYYGSITEFDAKDAVAKIRQLRADSQANLRAKIAPEQNALGTAQKAVADALEDELARHVDSIGRRDLVTSYQAARVTLAKARTVQSAMRGGRLSAKALSEYQNRGGYLTGELKQAADAYENFDRSLQDANKIRSHGPLSTTDYLIGLGAGLHNPFLAAGVLARPLARNFLASDRYQRGPVSTTKPQIALPKISPVGTAGATGAALSDQQGVPLTVEQQRARIAAAIRR